MLEQPRPASITFAVSAKFDVVSALTSRSVSYSPWSLRDWTTATHLWPVYRVLHSTPYSGYKTRLRGLFFSYDLETTLRQVKFGSAALAAGSFPCSIQVVYAYALYPHWSRSSLFNEQCAGDIHKFDKLRSAICFFNELRHSETAHKVR